MNKILSLIFWLFCLSVNSQTLSLEQNVSTMNFISFSIEDKCSYPIRFDAIMEATDTLVLNRKDFSSFFNRIFTTAYYTSDDKRYEEFITIFGNNNETIEAFYLLISDFNNFFLKNSKEQVFFLQSGDKVTMRCLSIKGFFMKSCFPIKKIKLDSEPYENLYINKICIPVFVVPQVSTGNAELNVKME